MTRQFGIHCFPDGGERQSSVVLDPILHGRHLRAELLRRRRPFDLESALPTRATPMLKTEEIEHGRLLVVARCVPARESTEAQSAKRRADLPAWKGSAGSEVS